MIHRAVSSTAIQDFPLWERARARRTPLSCELELTARCNNNCRHCYNNLPRNDGSARAAEISAAEILDFAKQAASMGALWCLLTGGEPLLRDDFPEIYLGLKKMGFLVTVFTNGTLVNRDLVALFKEHPPRDIEITVYGATRATYERVTRNPGSFACFQRGLALLMENDVPVRLKAMALRANVDEAYEITRFCRQRTKDFFRMDPFLHLRYDGNEQRNREIMRQRLSAGEILALERSDPDRLNALKKECKRLDPPGAKLEPSTRLFRCAIASGSFAVGYDGSYRPCSSLRHPDCTYDLRNGSLEDAWCSFTPEVIEMRSTRTLFLENCSTCRLFNLCMWCPAHAYLETGELDGFVPYFCELAHARAQSLQEIISDNKFDKAIDL